LQARSAQSWQSSHRSNDGGFRHHLPPMTMGWGDKTLCSLETDLHPKRLVVSMRG
jgi:hypothetical protein